MAMLLQMVDIVREEKPDVFLLCGDVYHTPQPSASVQTMFTNALVEIHDANPDMTIVITAAIMTAARSMTYSERLGKR